MADFAVVASHVETVTRYFLKVIQPRPYDKMDA